MDNKQIEEQKAYYVLANWQGITLGGRREVKGSKIFTVTTDMPDKAFLQVLWAAQREYSENTELIITKFEYVTPTP